MQYHYTAGSLVHVHEVTKFEVAPRLYLHFSQDSSIELLHGLSLEMIAKVNARCNRDRKRSYAEVLESSHGNVLSFVDAWTRRQKQRRVGGRK